MLEPTKEILSELKQRWRLALAGTRYENLLDADLYVKFGHTSMEARNTQFEYDVEKKTYRTSTGRPIPEAEIAAAVAFYEAKMKIGFHLVRGEDVDAVDEWEQEARLNTKDLYSTMVALAEGGWDMMGPRQWGRAGGFIGAQYRYIDEQSERARRGIIPVEALNSIAPKIVNTGYIIYSNSHRETVLESGEFTQERRVHSPKPCDDCQHESDLGWQRIGTLRLLGDSRCRQNCRCSYEYR